MASSAGVTSTAGIAGVLQLADEVAVAVDEPGDDPVAGDGERPSVGGRRVAGPQDRLDPLAGHEDPPVVQPRHRRRRRAGAERDDQAAGSASTMAASVAAAVLPFAGMTTTHRPAAVHRRRRRRPAPRQRTRWRCSSASSSTSRSRSRRPSAGRPSCSGGSATSMRPGSRPWTRRPSTRSSGRRRRCTASRARWPAASRSSAARSPTTTATTRAASGPRRPPARTWRRACSACRASASMKAKTAPRHPRQAVRGPAAGLGGGRADAPDPRRRGLARVARRLPGGQAREEGRAKAQAAAKT